MSYVGEASFPTLLNPATDRLVDAAECIKERLLTKTEVASSFGDPGLRSLEEDERFFSFDLNEGKTQSPKNRKTKQETETSESSEAEFILRL